MRMPDCVLLICRLCTSPCSDHRCLLKQVHLPASLRVKKSSSPVLAGRALQMLPHRPSLTALCQILLRVSNFCRCLVTSVCTHVTALLSFPCMQCFINHPVIGALSNAPAALKIMYILTCASSLSRARGKICCDCTECACLQLLYTS